jgi:periplasmic protein TonB
VLSAASALAIVASIAAMLFFGLATARIAPAPTQLVAIDVAPPRPQPTERPKPQVRASRKSAPKGKPSPPNLRNKATQVVAQRVPLLIEPPPIVAATEAGIGSAANTGASDRIGPGRGAGGIGDGDGGGGLGGDGDGDGGGGRAVVGPKQIKGRLGYDDLPAGLLAFGQEASVEVLYTVHPDGRVSHCRAVRSSGISMLDAVACQLIEKRFRFRPARDRAGKPVRADVIETHTWVEDGEGGQT